MQRAPLPELQDKGDLNAYRHLSRHDALEKLGMFELPSDASDHAPVEPSVPLDRTAEEGSLQHTSEEKDEGIGSAQDAIDNLIDALEAHEAANALLVRFGAAGKLVEEAKKDPDPTLIAAAKELYTEVSEHLEGADRQTLSDMIDILSRWEVLLEGQGKLSRQEELRLRFDAAVSALEEVDGHPADAGLIAAAKEQLIRLTPMLRKEDRQEVRAMLKELEAREKLLETPENGGDAQEEGRSDIR
jgi:hypothetical protein